MATKKNATDNQDNASSTVAIATAPSLAEFNPRDPQALLATAAQLAQFVTDNKLASNIQGRSYVQAEGWQFLFAVAGLDVICSKPTRLERATEVCYEAEARLFDVAGREVGYGYAICSDAERLKKGWAEYAIASMAQTRAIGKAGRNRFAFVMKAAGFEPTPAEEMSEVGTSATVVGGNAPAAQPQPVMRAESNSAAPVASTGSAQSIAGPANIPAEVLTKFTRQFEAATSGIDVKKLWDSLTKNEATALFEVKEAAKARLATAASQAAATVGREVPAAMKDAGSDSALIDEFCEQPIIPNLPTITYATGEQKECIQRLLNHPLITRKEKTKLLLNINKLDTERARQALGKLRTAITQREGYSDPTEAEQIGEVRAAIGLLLKQHEGKLEIEDEAPLRAALANERATLEELQDALRAGQIAAWDAETDGTERELDQTHAAA